MQAFIYFTRAPAAHCFQSACARWCLQLPALVDFLWIVPQESKTWTLVTSLTQGVTPFLKESIVSRNWIGADFYVNNALLYGSERETVQLCKRQSQWGSEKAQSHFTSLYRSLTTTCHAQVCSVSPYFFLWLISH